MQKVIGLAIGMGLGIQKRMGREIPILKVKETLISSDLMRG